MAPDTESHGYHLTHKWVRHSYWVDPISYCGLCTVVVNVCNINIQSWKDVFPQHFTQLVNLYICLFEKKNPIMLMTTMTTFTYVDVIQQCSFLHWYNLINHLLDCNGYRLLYYMTMMNRNCTNSLLRNSYSTMPVIRWLCALMLKEREIISQMGYPHILRDLALEQCKLNV